MAEDNEVFMSQTDVASKITKTEIIENIPKNASKQPLNNWKRNYVTEWRWRFIKANGRHIVEISQTNAATGKRTYFNKHGNWIEEHIDASVDKFVVDQYYYYTNV